MLCVVLGASKSAHHTHNWNEASCSERDTAILYRFQDNLTNDWRVFPAIFSTTSFIRQWRLQPAQHSTAQHKPRHSQFSSTWLSSVLNLVASFHSGRQCSAMQCSQATDLRQRRAVVINAKQTPVCKFIRAMEVKVVSVFVSTLCHSVCIHWLGKQHKWEINCVAAQMPPMHVN